MTFAVFASSAFFVALSFGLLLRYRQVSQKVNASTDLGRNLWEALEQRLRKQDERILDMMAKFEVIQSRLREKPVAPVPRPASSPASVGGKPVSVMDTYLTSPQPKSQTTLDETELSVIRLLDVKPRNSVEIKELIGKTREHAARLMKTLFDSGLVTRDTSKKPFVYQLTEAGRRYLPAS
jgi:CRP-like cAMP-binding protein